MSAFGIGRELSSARLRSDGGGVADFVGRVVRWIPGDSIVLYAGSITWLGATNPSRILLLVFAVATPLLLILGAWSRPPHGLVGRRDFILAGLSIGAFLLWSLSMPGSGWQAWEWISRNQGWVIVISTLGSVMYALFASGVELRLEAARAEDGDELDDWPGPTSPSTNAGAD